MLRAGGGAAYPVAQRNRRQDDQAALALTEPLPDNAPFLYRQIAASLARLIETGTLQPGDRLPSVRTLSRQRGVSISTVLQAYRFLEDRRLIDARPQSGYYVRLPARQRPTEPQISDPPPAPTEVSIGELAVQVIESVSNPALAPLGTAVPGPTLLPTARLNRTLAAAVRRMTGQANQYLTPQGYDELRRLIALRSFDWGANLAADDLLITCGCMEALALCLRAVATAGDTIAVESPAYFGTLQLIESFHMKALEIPTHPRHGLSIEALGQALELKSVRACIVTPNFHNPLGSLMPNGRKQALVELMAHHDLPLIEDDLNGDLHFGPRRPPSLKAFDTTGLVMHCGSFSKTLAPDYRVGWTAPGRFLDAVKRIKASTTIATAVPLQIALADFLDNGGYDRHLRRLRRTFADNLDRMARVVSDVFPAGTRATRPAGGFVLWVELPSSIRALDLYHQALRQKISIAPGPIFSATGQFPSCIRLSGGYPWSGAIEQALYTLGRLAGGRGA